MALRVLQLINKFTRRSGPERLVLTLATGLDPARFQSQVAMLDFRRFAGPSQVEEALGPDGRVTLLPWHKGHLLAEALGGLRRLVRESGIDIIHCHDVPADLVAALGTGLGRRRPGLISSRHGYIDYRAKLRLMAWIDNRVLSRFDRVVIATAALRPTLPRSVQGRVAVIPNAVAVDCPADPAQGVRLREQLGIPTAAPVVLALGRVFPEKGHRDVIEAIPALRARHPQTRVVLVGEGPLLEALRARASALGVAEAFLPLGFIEDTEAAYALCDVFVQPSLSESFALTVFEAMARGRPVVATRVGGMAEHLSDGVTALLVPAGDPAALAEAVGDLLADAPGRAALGARGRDLVVERYSDRAYVAAFGDLYEAVARERGRGSLLVRK